MPYHVVKNGDRFCVEKKDGSKSFGCHPTQAEADKQLAALYANEPKGAEARQLHLLGALGTVRTEMFEGREHLVVPVIALMDGVIHAVNAATPERVTEATLSKAASSWNGRPITLGHPVKEGRQISANDARVIETQSFGQIFNSRMAGPKLLMDAYIDPVKAEKIGGKDLLQLLRDGKMCEVSVGAFVVTDNVAGEHNGKPFKATWLDTLGDHLAFLPNGRGACSMTMGCGANRAATMRVCEDRFELEALAGPMIENAQVGDMKVGDKVIIDRPGHASHGKTGVIKSTAKGGRVHTVEGLGTFHRSRLTAAFGVVRDKLEIEPEENDRLEALSNPEGINQYTVHGTDLSGRESVSHHASLKEARIEARFMVKARGSTHVVKDKNGKTLSIHEHAGYSNKWGNELLGSQPNPTNVERVTYPGKPGTGFGRPGRKNLQAPDTPEQAASEEAAELIGYETMREICDQLNASYDAMSNIVDDLIADEEDDPTQTAAQEEAEEEIEDARLGSIQTFAMSMYSDLNALMSLVSDMLQPDPADVTIPRYMAKREELRVAEVAALKDCDACKGLGQVNDNECTTCEGAGELKDATGARNSASDTKIIQGVHDHSVALGAVCDAQNTRFMQEAAEEKPNVDEAAARAAEEVKLKAACGCNKGEPMTPEIRAEVIKNLIADKHSGFTAGDEKLLEAASDERLESFKVAAEARALEVKEIKDLKTANDKQLTADEFMKAAPPELRSLITRQQERETARKADLVAALKTAQDEYAEAALSAMPIDELERMARMTKAKVQEKNDFSGRGLAYAGTEANDFTPPDPYADGIKALRESVN